MFALSDKVIKKKLNLFHEESAQTEISKEMQVLIWKWLKHLNTVVGEIFHLFSLGFTRDGKMGIE